MGDPSGNYTVTLIIPSCILFKDPTPSAPHLGTRFLLQRLFPSKEEINFKHFNVEGHSKKGVKRVIENTTIININENI
jgi:hypothetical protein